MAARARGEGPIAVPRGWPALLLVGVGVLGACAGQESPSAEPSGVSSPAPTPSPSPTPTPEPVTVTIAAAATEALVLTWETGIR